MKRSTEEIIVPFRNWRFILLFSGLTVFGSSLVCQSRPGAWMANVFGWLVLLMAGAYFFFWTSRNLRNAPALKIGPEGIMNAISFLRKRWYPWKEVTQIYLTGNPWMYQRQMAFVTKRGTFWVSESVIGITLDELRNIISEVGDFKGKIGVHWGYKNSRMTMGSLAVTLLAGLLLAVGVVGAICFAVLDRENNIFRLFPILFLVIAMKAIGWYFPVNFNPRFRNKLPLPVNYFLLTSVSAVALVTLMVLCLSSWIGSGGSLAAGFLFWWILPDRILKRKYGIKLI